MRTERQLEPLVRAWLRRTSGSPHSTSETIGDVMSRLPQTRQRGRWWPLPLVRRRVAPRPQDTGLEAVSGPHVADGYATVTWRVHAMFTPVRAIVAVVLASSIGGLALVAQPFDRQDVGIPAAETTVVGESTGVTGISICRTQLGGSLDEGSMPYRVTGLVLTCQETASDPRVEGDSTVAITIEGWGEGLKLHDPANSITWNDYELKGPDGTWSGRGHGFYDANGDAHRPRRPPVGQRWHTPRRRDGVQPPRLALPWVARRAVRPDR